MFFAYILFSIMLNSLDNLEEVVVKDYNYTKALIESTTDLVRKDILAQEFIDKYGEDNFYSYEFSDYIIKRCIRNKKMGFCYTDSKIAIEPVYDYAGPFHNGYAMVEKNGKWGIIDKKGTIIVDIKLSKPQAKKQVDELRKKNIKNPYIDTPETRYQKGEIKDDDYIMVTVGNRVGFVDKHNKELIPFKYESSYGFMGDIAPVRFNGKWGYIDKKDKVIIDFKYDEIGFFYYDRAMVKKGKKWGFIDRSGKEVIALKYDYVNNFSDGLSMVEENGKIGFIDVNGNFRIPLKYEWGSSFYFGIAEIKYNGRDGYVDLWGNELLK